MDANIEFTLWDSGRNTGDSLKLSSTKEGIFLIIDGGNKRQSVPAYHIQNLERVRDNLD